MFFMHQLTMFLLQTVYHLSKTYHKIHIKLICLKIKKAETQISKKEVMYISFNVKLYENVQFM